MRISICVGSWLLPVMLLARAPGAESTASLIKKLGSANFQERIAASKALEERPEAEEALRAALRSNDAEIAKRASQILGLFRVRELDGAAKSGQVEALVEILARWEDGKNEPEAWHAARSFARVLLELHEKNGGQKIKRALDRCAMAAPAILSAKRVTESTVAELERSYFVRTEHVDIKLPKIKPGAMPKNTLDHGAFFVASRSVGISNPGGYHLIFAGGSVELQGTDGFNSIVVVSGGDVVIDCALVNSLVIARGKVTCKDSADSSRIISGKSVVTIREPLNCKISENEMSPLGFIRWAEPKKADPSP